MSDCRHTQMQVQTSWWLQEDNKNGQTELVFRARCNACGKDLEFVDVLSISEDKKELTLRVRVGKVH